MKLRRNDLLQLDASLINVKLPNSPEPIILPHCKPVMVKRMIRDPQFWHYDSSKAEVFLVRVRKDGKSDSK